MNEKKQKNTYLIIGILIFIIAAGVIFALECRMLKNETALVETPQTEEVTKNENAISVPGYESLTVKAGEIRQSLVFYNPAQNNCYFRISLYLADDTLVWQSALIPPGMQTEKIDLLIPLDKGTYPDSYLIYDAFYDESETTACNGAKTVLTVFAR